MRKEKFCFCLLQAFCGNESRSCWLKSSCTGVTIDPTVVSGGNGGGGPAPPPPTPPAPTPPSPTPPPPPRPPAPGPPAPKSLQVGVSLGGWLVMETSWMVRHLSPDHRLTLAHVLKYRRDANDIRALRNQLLSGSYWYVTASTLSTDMRVACGRLLQYDQFSVPAENDWVRKLRTTSDTFAVSTMQRHWGEYIPDEALDAAKSVGIDHVRFRA